MRYKEILQMEMGLLKECGRDRMGMVKLGEKYARKQRGTAQERCLSRKTKKNMTERE
jgi:hypothetical protein